MTFLFARCATRSDSFSTDKRGDAEVFWRDPIVSKPVAGKKGTKGNGSNAMSKYNFHQTLFLKDAHTAYMQHKRVTEPDFSCSITWFSKQRCVRARACVRVCASAHAACARACVGSCVCQLVVRVVYNSAAVGSVMWAPTPGVSFFAPPNDGCALLAPNALGAMSSHTRFPGQ